MQTDTDIHGLFREETMRMLENHPHERAVFESLWTHGEYRWAWRYIQDEVLTEQKIPTTEGFRQANEQFCISFMA